MIGNVSTTSTLLSATLTSFNIIFLTKRSRVSGVRSPHLKNSNQLGKRNATLQDSELITLLSTGGWRSLGSTTGNSTTSRCSSFHSVRVIITHHDWISLQ